MAKPRRPSFRKRASDVEIGRSSESIRRPLTRRTSSRNYNNYSAIPESEYQEETEMAAVGAPADPEFEGLTLYEKKSLLINRDLDRQGMGKYQWCIFFLCGFGYLLDLLWAQAFGLIVTPMQQEFGFSDAEFGNLFSAFSAGLTIGAFGWGFIIDIIGRYWAFSFTVLWSSIFGLVVGLPNSYGAVTVLAAGLGIGVGGNIPVDTTICLECLPQNRRWLLPALSVFQPIGVVICSLFCYGFIPNYSCAQGVPSCNAPDLAPGTQCCTKADNMGWRYVLYTLGGITLAVFVTRFFLFNFQESPKYLIYRGNDEQAIKSLQHIAKFNGRKSEMSLEKLAALSEDDSSAMTGPKSGNVDAKTKASQELQRYKMFFANSKMIRLTVALWLIYAFDYWGFTIAGAFLPKILKEKGQELGLSIQETYRAYVYIYLFGIPGVLLGASIYGWRRISMLASSALFAAALFAFTMVSSEASYIGINGMVYFFQSMFNAILYGATPEFFPAPIRGTACGVSSFWGRVFSVIAPLVASQVLAHSLNGVLYLAGGSVFICTFLILFIPTQYMSGQSH